jgi:hypothetical protein
MTRQLVYEPYKHVVVGFRVSTRLTNHVGFGLVGQPSRPKPDMATRFANPMLHMKRVIKTWNGKTVLHGDFIDCSTIDTYTPTPIFLWSQ